MALGKTKRLRQMLNSSHPVIAAGVYDGLSASVAERAGFQALWASGFCISASKGLPDVGLISMSEHLSSTSEINVSSNLPVIADVDDGFGDAVNVVRMVRKYEAAGVAAISLEDNCHPKRNSLFGNLKGRKLVDMHEFAAKIRAAKDTQVDPDFVVIARTEALIANMGLEEALKRAHCYADAGADMILVHSKDSDPKNVLDFGKRWDRDIPLVAVPTMYPTVETDELFDHGYRLVIFANHAMRAAVSAMDHIFQKMMLNKSLVGMDQEVAPLSEVFSLVNYEEVNLISTQYIEQNMKVENILVDKVLLKNPKVIDEKTAIIYGD